MSSPARSRSRSGSSDHRRVVSRSPRSRSRSGSRHRAHSRSRSARSRSGRSRSFHSRSRSRSYEMKQPTGDRERPDPTNCLGVFGLNYATTQRDLEHEFGKFGPLEKVNLVLDGPTKKSRGFAFVYFESLDDASKARDALNGTELQNFKVRVDYSITKEAHKPTPGVYYHHGKALKPGERDRRPDRRGPPSSRGRPRYRDDRDDYYRSRGDRPPYPPADYDREYYDRAYYRDKYHEPRRDDRYRDERYERYREERYEDRYYEDRYYREREYERARMYKRRYEVSPPPPIGYSSRSPRYERERYPPPAGAAPRPRPSSSRRSPSPGGRPPRRARY